MKRMVPSQLRTSTYSLRRHLWQRLHNPSGVSRPVFLLGCGRSGTSMLVLHLSRSWEVELYNEDHPQAFEKWHLRHLADIKTLVHQSYARVVLFKSILDTHLACRLLDYFPNAKLIFAFAAIRMSLLQASSVLVKRTSREGLPNG